MPASVNGSVKSNEIIAIDPLIKKIMDRQNLILELFNDGKYDTAHRLKDELFYETIKIIIADSTPRTKRTILEILDILKGIDDWGI